MIGELKIIYNWFLDYYADCVYLVFSILSAIYLMMKKRNQYKKIILPSIFLYVLVLNPVLYKFVFSSIVYWRLFWMIPNSFIIILAIGEILRKSNKISERIVICIGVISLVFLLGHSVFDGAKRGDEINRYRLSQETVDVGSIMIEYDETPKCIVPASLISSIRLYSGNIEPMYGRNAQGYINRASDEVLVMYNVMESENPDYDYVLTRAKHWGYNFVVNTQNKPIDETLLCYYGYELLKSIDGYNIYYNKNINDEPLEGYRWLYNDVGWWLEDSSGNCIKQSVKEVYGVYYYFNKYGYAIESVDSETAKNISEGDMIVTQFGDDNYDKPSMFYTIDNQKGDFIIIDGGNNDEYDKVLKQIQLYGGTVDAWILTHPHEDHIGAFNEIYNNHINEVKVNKIYAIDIDSDYYHEVYNEWDNIDCFDDFEKIIQLNGLKDNNKLEYVKDGDVYMDGVIPFKVLNTFTNKSYDISTGSLPNAASMVLKLYGNKESMLFLGDIEQESANSILSKYGSELEATYIQTAHHGQNLDAAFYNHFEPRAVMVDAPNWLRQKDDSTHTSFENIEYFNERKIPIYTYDTAPNVILVK